MGFFERETVLELLRPAIVLITIFLIESFALDHTTKAIIGVLAILFLALLDFLLRKGARIRALRRRWYPLARLEGVWLQRVDNPRPYSIACIQYEAKGRWRYYGIGYDESFKPAAQWSTTSAIHNRSNSTWHFAGEAMTLKLNPQLNIYETASRGHVVPILQLPSEPLWETISHLDGTVIDLKIDQKDAVFAITLYRAATGVFGGRTRLPLPEEIRALGLKDIEKMFAEAKVPLLARSA